MNYLNKPLCIHGGAIGDCDVCGRNGGEILEPTITVNREWYERVESTYKAQEMALAELRSRLALADRLAWKAYWYKEMVESGKVHDDHAVAIEQDLQIALAAYWRGKPPQEEKG